MGLIERLKKSQKKRKFIVSEESAFEQFNRLIEHYSLGHIIEHLDNLEAKERGAVELEIEMIINDIRYGVFEIPEPGENGLEIKHTISNGEIFTYKEMDAQSILVIEKYKTTREKTWGLLGYLSGQGPDVIKKLKPEDRRPAEVLSSFLLAV